MSETSGSDRLVLISADGHAGGNHEQYRGYLASMYLDRFDAWRQRDSNPFKDLTGRRPASGCSRQRWPLRPAARHASRQVKELIPWVHHTILRLAVPCACSAWHVGRTWSRLMSLLSRR
jgi:hypothetical protein